LGKKKDDSLKGGEKNNPIFEREHHFYLKGAGLPREQGQRDVEVKKSAEVKKMWKEKVTCGFVLPRGRK